MKKNILAIAIATAVAAPAAMADAKIYGYFNTALENVSTGDTTGGTTWDNRNSRIGIKGSEDLGNGLKAIYQFETGVNINTGSWNGAGDTKRNTYLGLAGNFGTVLAGRHDTPLRMIQPTDHFADAKYAGSNRGTFNGISNGVGTGEDRLDNVVAYLSPNFSGFSFALAGAQGNGGSKGDKDRSPVNAYSASVSYGKKSDGLYLAGAYTKVTDKFGTVVNADAAERKNYRLTAQYRADGMTANLMYNQLKRELADDKLQSVTVGFAYDINAFTPKVKLAYVKGDEGFHTADTESDKSWVNVAIGLDYKLGKNTKTFVEVAQINKKQAFGDDLTGEYNDRFKNTTSFTIGMNHKF